MGAGGGGRGARQDPDVLPVAAHGHRQRRGSVGGPRRRQRRGRMDARHLPHTRRPRRLPARDRSGAARLKGARAGTSGFRCPAPSTTRSCGPGELGSDTRRRHEMAGPGPRRQPCRRPAPVRHRRHGHDVDTALMATLLFHASVEPAAPERTSPNRWAEPTRPSSTRAAAPTATGLLVRIALDRSRVRLVNAPARLTRDFLPEAVPGGRGGG
ncbi:hypothetical protein SCOCK_400011 [Actinacidiphila cocklensis]|uniref:Uncharacterized protein n=1 Tax=Actinacidiphila cocklensis TaxID=887465 RepID=A0A9W4GTC0_9ACTN|nr:hypothetical protein SCOCK_400011 [Actinacidiphila cocklensis]